MVVEWGGSTLSVLVWEGLAELFTRTSVSVVTFSKFLMELLE